VVSSRTATRAAISLLAAIHLAVVVPGFFAPYSPNAQNRSLAFAPPTRIHFLDPQHRLHFRPFVYPLILAPGTFSTYQEDRSAIAPIRFFVYGAPYRVFGLFTSRLHLFGAQDQTRILLAGTDAYGRDQLSRLLYGGRISLFAGLLATAISLTLGIALGGFAGYYTGWFDEITMRATEIFMTVPWLYLLLSVRAFLPLHMPANRIFLLLLAVLGIIGWARPARLIRGVVLSAKNRDYVLAAKGFGASDVYILRRHVWPLVSGVAATQAVVYIPQFILAEVTLSFFGLGVSEPDPSWGNMLAALQQPFVLENCWWLFAPAALLTGVFLAYYWLISRYTTSNPRI
jgi:peptide/nickel transport system permease protein